MATRAPVVRFVVEPDEREWVDGFLRGPMDRATRVLRIDEPFDSPAGFGFVVGRRLLDACAAQVVPGVPPWPCPRLQAGRRDHEQLAILVASFARHVAGTWIGTVALVFEPAWVVDPRAYLRWLERFVRLLAPYVTNVRVVLVDDARTRAHEPLVRSLGRAAYTLVPTLQIADRIAHLVETTTDGATLLGRLRVMTTRAMLLVSAGRLADAGQLASAIEAIAVQAGAPGASVPARFAHAGGLLAAREPEAAITAYRTAESSAERAQDAGEEDALRLRVLARFGCGAALSSVAAGTKLAPRHYATIPPLCAELGDVGLEIEAHRMTSVAHQRAKQLDASWDAAMRALLCLPRVEDPVVRDQSLTTLEAWTDTLTRSCALRHHRAPLAAALARVRARWARST